MKHWKHDFAEKLTPEQAFKKNVLSGTSLKEYRERAKDDGECQCGRPVWRITGLGMCFTCTTGESDASNDYELKLIR